MTMTDYFQQFNGKWVMILLSNGVGTYVNGIVKEIGDDYIVVLETENELPRLISNRHIVSIKPMRVKENGKPKLFG